MVGQAYPEDEGSGLASDDPALAGLRILASIIADYHMRRCLYSHNEDFETDDLCAELHCGTKDSDDKERNESP
jgi:hypothetical protein